MMQVLSLVALLELLSFGHTARRRPGMEAQGPSLNGAPLQALGPSGRFAVEALELPNGTLLGR